MTDSTTLPSAAPFTLDRRLALHLAPDQSMVPVPMGDDAWARAHAVPALQDGRILSVFAYRSSWTWWERHPVGDELVLVLSGAAVFHLCDEAVDRSSAVAVGVAAGEGLLIPALAWHRADLAEPTTMLFVTPAPARTEHRDA